LISQYLLHCFKVLDSVIVISFFWIFLHIYLCLSLIMYTLLSIWHTTYSFSIFIFCLEKVWTSWTFFESHLLVYINLMSIILVLKSCVSLFLLTVQCLFHTLLLLNLYLLLSLLHHLCFILISSICIMVLHSSDFLLFSSRYIVLLLMSIILYINACSYQHYLLLQISCLSNSAYQNILSLYQFILSWWSTLSDHSILIVSIIY
jgi:hypothetical protein